MSLGWGLRGFIRGGSFGAIPGALVALALCLPEPLKHALQGFWSRRINSEHRIVYKAGQGTILTAQLRYHY